MSDQDLCKHFIDQYISKSVAGRKIHRDQCVKCYDDPVRISYINFFHLN